MMADESKKPYRALLGEGYVTLVLDNHEEVSHREPVRAWLEFTNRGWQPVVNLQALSGEPTTIFELAIDEFVAATPVLFIEGTWIAEVTERTSFGPGATLTINWENR